MGQAIGMVLGGAQLANAGGQGAQAGKQMPQVQTGQPSGGAAPISPDAPGTPGFAQRAAAGVNKGAGLMQQLEHPAWGVIDRLAGGALSGTGADGKPDRMSFAQNNPQLMSMIKSYFD